MSLDQFGVEQKLQIYDQKPTSKSSIGGIVTLILYGASLGYFLSEFVDWTLNNKLPKITSFQEQISEGESILLEDRFLEISSSQWKNDLIDPFDPEALIYYPIIYEIPGNWSNMKVIESEMEILTLDNGRQIYNFFIKDKIIQGSPPNKGQQKNYYDYQIILVQCDQIDKNKNLKCANSSKISQYAVSQNFISVSFYITQFNTKTKSLYKIPKTYEVGVSQDILSFYQYNLQATTLQVNDGILFNNINQYKYISDFEYSFTTFDQNYSLANFGMKASFQLYVTMNQMKQDVSLEYPNISEILANTGSIITWILQLSFFVSKYNDKIFSEQTLKDIIRMYYPDIDDLILQKNLFGKILGASIKEKKYDPNKVNKFLQNLHELAESKLNYINLQYEVSRIQLVLSETLGINYIKKHMVPEACLEKMMDTMKYTIEHPRLIQNNPSDQTIHPIQSQDSSYQEISIPPENQESQPSQTLIGNYLGLLTMKLTQQKQLIVSDQNEIIPNANCKKENVEN